MRVYTKSCDVSSNLQTDTAQSAEIKRLPGYAARLRVCTRDKGREKKKTHERKCSQTDTD